MEQLEEFATKLEKELKTGLLSLLLMSIIRKKEKTYGYEIIKNLEEMIKGKLKIQEGTIYPLLRNLETQGILASYWDNSIEGKPARKYYSLTAKGKIALKNGIVQWNEIVEIAKIVLEVKE